MSVLYDAMKSITLQYDTDRIAAGVVFGTVRSESPLTIEIGQKITLTERFVTVAQHLTDYEIPYNILSEESATHRDKLKTEFNEISEIDDFYVMHEGRQDVQVGGGLLGVFNGTGTIKLLNHLMEGDRVILLRMEGGDQYVVIDRIGLEYGSE